MVTRISRIKKANGKSVRLAVPPILEPPVLKPPVAAAVQLEESHPPSSFKDIPPALLASSSFVEMQRTEGSLADLLRRAAARPEAKMVFVQPDESEHGLSYAEILQQASARLAGMREAGFTKDSLAPLVFSEGIDFVISFWACMLGGIVAVPLTFPTSFSVENNALKKLFEVWRQLGSPTVLGDRLLVQRLSEVAVHFGAADLKILDVKSLDRADAVAAPSPGLGDTLALIQYSSGSTGSPKGVALSHRNLLTNVEACAMAMHMQCGDTFVSWMPFSHDMGLIGMHLVPIHSQASQVNLSPSAFIRRPLLWLEKMSQHQAVFTGSPNFGYRLVLERLTAEQAARWDLSRVRAIFNGAEPISVALAQEFMQALAPARLAPSAMYTVYGMAEACVAVTFPPMGSLPVVRCVDRRGLAEKGEVHEVDAGHLDAMWIADEGHPVPSCSVRIVDEQGHLVPEGRVGHVQISGANVTRGYYNNPQATRELLDGEWLRTGDMGFVAEGRLSITGRHKDVVIVNGQKFFAYDIEASAESIEGVRAGRAVVCGWHDAQAGRERVVLFVAVASKASSGAEGLRQLLSQLWQHINTCFSIALDHIVVVKQVPRTTSGKLQRYQMREAFLAGKFQSATYDAWQLMNLGLAQSPASHAPAEALNQAQATPDQPPTLQERVRHIWAEVLRRDAAAIPPHESFLALGGTSIKAVQVLGRLEEALGTRLSHEFLLQCRTVAQMAAWLAAHLAREEHSCAAASDLNTSPVLALDEDIAVIGVACQFPQADSPEAFWRNLLEGRDAITEVPADRWNVERWYAPGAPVAGKTNSRWGGFLNNPYAFDAAFFGIAPEEAAIMDPQQRLFMQTSWQALERAGYSGKGSEGQRVGVFVGASHNNYMEHHVRGLDLARLQQFDSFTALPPAQRTALLEEWRLCFGEPGAQPNTAVDNLLNMIAARTSHALNLKGPSLAIDTACSSSLVALHLACESLRRGECEMALAGGVNLNLSPTPYLLFARAGTLSPHGRCKVFDEDADGFVPGEGVGTVVLKPLARAQADGDAVLAVIKRSVVNNDGRSLGVMAPNPDGQRVAIAGVYREGGLNDLSPAHIQYLEAHGTGTAIGDPSELRSLAEVFNDVPRASCVVGSVKANVGHLLSAAGIASFIKLVLMLQHKRMPPSLHVQRPTAQLRDAQTPFRLLENAEHWHAPENMPRRGAINSFGFGGTNCHMVLEEAPAPHLSSAAEPPAHVLCVSAHSEDALRQRALDLARCLTQPAFGDSPLSPLSPLSPVDAAHWRAVDVCHSSNAGRSHFAHRLAVVSDTLEGLAEKLATAQPSLAQRPEVALMFTGQGSQYPGMAQRLYETLPAFRAHLDACAAAFAPYLDLPLTDSLYGAAASAEALAQTRLTQPVVFAIDYAMGRVLMDWGVKPACLMGHSVGEYAAAALAGVMSLADAAKIVAARGRLINALPAGGGMAALFDSHEAVAKWIEPYAGRLWFAAHNGHQQVVSGERAALEALQTELQAHAKVCRLLQVSHAFHTPLLAPMLEEFAQVLAQVQFAPPQVPIVSNLHGVWHDAHQAQTLDAAHWLAHVTAPVCFEQGVRLAFSKGIRAFIECGPDKILTGLTRATLAADAALVLPTLDKRGDDWNGVLATVARLYAEGVDLDWRAFAAHSGARRVVLPTYPFAHESHRIATDDAGRVPAAIKAEAKKTAAENEAAVHAAVQATVHATVQAAALAERAPAGAEREASLGSWRDIVRQLVAEITQVNASQVDLYRNFHDLGLDSAAAVRLAERLGHLAQTRLPATLLFEYQSPVALVGYLEALGAAPLDVPVGAQTHAHGGAQVGANAGARAPAQISAEVRDQDIAIIGMACRVPGADNPDEFWQLLLEGRSAVREIKPEQWSLRDYFRSNGQASHTSYSKWGAFLDKPYDFDPLFFGISPREAEVMDPQQRLFLEVAWESLQSAGYGGDFRTREIGVFVGCEQNHYGEHFVMNQRYQALMHRLDEMEGFAQLSSAQQENFRSTVRDVLQPAELIPDAVAGQGMNEIAARVSHWLDLRGPNFVINTACSSSLVALHLACASLRRGESRLVIAGAAYLALNESPYVALSRVGALSPTGRCSPFDERADGMVLGEGVSAVVLKPLKEALRDGDVIHAVIKGSAINNDGHSNGITAPNPRGQADAICKAYADAGIAPESVSYIECHGTGTPLGDPVELEGMTQAFRKFTPRKNFCAIGSLKSSFGHMLSGSSLPGLIKVVLALKHQTIPATYGFEQPNPHIDFAHSPFYVAAHRAQAWQRAEGQPLRAGINSFGFGGSNCHVLLEEAPRPTSNQTEAGPQLLLLTGRTQAVLQQMARRLNETLLQHPEYSAAQICASMNSAQRDMAFKVALRVTDAQDLSRKLTRLSEGESGGGGGRGEGVEWARVNPRQAPTTYLLLDDANPLREGEIEALAQRFAEIGSLLERCRQYRQELFPAHLAPPAALHMQSQLDAFVAQYALSRLGLRTQIKPEALIAEGVGALVGCCLLGYVGVRDAMALLCQKPAQAEVTSAEVTSAEVTSAEVTRAEVISAEVTAHGSDAGALCRCPLVMPHAVVQPQSTQAAVQGVAHAMAQIQGALISNATPMPSAFSSLTQADLKPWLRSEALFLHLGGSDPARLELKSALHGLADATGQGTSAQDISERVLALWAGLYVRGLRFDAKPLANANVQRVALPTYPFENKPYRFKWAAFKNVPREEEGLCAAPKSGDADAPIALPSNLLPINVQQPPSSSDASPDARLDALPAARLRPGLGAALSSDQRKAAHEALRNELSQLMAMN